MIHEITGKAYVLGDNIDTDQIIPAEHLVYSIKDPEESKLYGSYALSGVPSEDQGLPLGNQPFVEKGAYVSEYQIIIGGHNFGCGSSREHAPFALRKAGVKAVIAQSYARIFFRNSVDGAFYPPIESENYLIDKIKTGDMLTINNLELINQTQNETYRLKPLGDVLDILEAGGIFAYAKKSGLIKG